MELLNQRGYRDKPSGQRSFGLQRIAVMVAFLGTSLVVTRGSNASAGRVPPPGSGIAEYKAMAAESVAAVRATLRSLDKIAGCTNPCPRKVVAAFCRQVQKMRVASLRVRSRALAIQARGDSYFQDWQDNLARVKDPKVRELAERFRPQLQQAFAGIKLASQEAHEAYKSFSFGLLKFQIALENNAGVIETAAAKDLARTTRSGGEEVLRKLGAIQGELQTMSELLNPARHATDL